MLEIIQSSSIALSLNYRVRVTRIHKKKTTPIQFGKMPLFRTHPKTPQEIVKAMKDALQVLKAEQAGSKKCEKVMQLNY